VTLSVRYRTKPQYPLFTANGRAYPTNGAATIDIPLPDGAAIDPGMVAQTLMVVGTTSERPLYDPALGAVPTPTMYDSSLSKVIFWVVGSYPAVWTDIAGSVV
jgi:hypothetical protein